MKNAELGQQSLEIIMSHSHGMANAGHSPGWLSLAFIIDQRFVRYTYWIQILIWLDIQCCNPGRTFIFLDKPYLDKKKTLPKLGHNSRNHEECRTRSAKSRYHYEPFSWHGQCRSKPWLTEFGIHHRSHCNTLKPQLFAAFPSLHPFFYFAPFCLQKDAIRICKRARTGAEKLYWSISFI